jgi:hypothetical protein
MVQFIFVTKLFPITVATNCRALIHCMNVLSYVAGHEQAGSLFYVYRIYSMSIDNILIWIGEVYYAI